MAITYDTALQMVKNGKLKQSRFDSMLKRGKISNPDYKGQVKSGPKGIVMTKFSDGMYVVVRMYPTHYKMKPKKMEFTKQHEALACYDEQVLAVTSKYNDVKPEDFDNQRVAVKESGKKIAMK